MTFPSNYDIKDISASAFLDEPPLGRLEDQGGNNEECPKPESSVKGSPERSTLHRIQCGNTATIKELITSFVKSVQSEMKEAEVRTDLLQEVVFSLNETVELDWRRPTPALISNINRSVEWYREWVEFATIPVSSRRIFELASRYLSSLRDKP
ncbi:uncharacterized protein DFL_006584 [Arthrobotrys flagrans]|uniref:Uncharacterized protein n=1 Tax=Arthrobotrys flagrans TaxID=97331 RepID=A0A436ZT79_ARTFL|nr:hypothetical protein DFL_006584 [Arthrobotrys flagrans]